MTTRPKDIGTAAETAVVRYLRGNGFPHAERRALTGSLDQGDITGTPGIAWEVKGGAAAARASDGQVNLWLAETEAERVNAHADHGILIIRRAGIGPANAGRWWAITDTWTITRLTDPRAVIYDDPDGTAPRVHVRVHLADITRLLRWAGYGQEITQGGAA
jgi:hypothetical protein